MEKTTSTAADLARSVVRAGLAAGSPCITVQRADARCDGRGRVAIDVLWQDSDSSESESLVLSAHEWAEALASALVEEGLCSPGRRP